MKIPFVWCSQQAIQRFIIKIMKTTHGIESLNYLEIYQFAFDLTIDHTTATNYPILDHSKVALVMQITFFEKKNQIYHHPKIWHFTVIHILTEIKKRSTCA